MAYNNRGQRGANRGASYQHSGGGGQRSDYQNRGAFSSDRGRGRPYDRPPGGGTRPIDVAPAYGQVVKVRTNCFAINRLPRDVCYQYKTFEPEVKTRDRRVQLFHRLQDRVAAGIFARKAVFDGKDLAYSFGLLRLTDTGGGVATFPVGLGDNDSRNKSPYHITLTLTSGVAIPMSNLAAMLNALGQPGTNSAMNASEIATSLNILQLIIRQESDQKYPHNKTSFFMPDHRDSKPLGRSGLELVKGFFQSVKPTFGGRTIINVDVSMTAMFSQQSALTMVMRFFNQSDVSALQLSPNDHFYHEVRKLLKGLRITVQTERGKQAVKVIRGLEPQGAMYEFIDKLGKRTTVRDYYRDAYSKHLRYPYIVAIVLSKPDAPKPTIVPLELCEIVPHQIYKRRLPPSLQSEAVTFGTTRPRDRWHSITGNGDPSAQTPILGYSRSPYVIAAEMDISRTPLEVSGKILAPPALRGRDPRIPMSPEVVLPVAGGAWNFNATGFHQPMKLLPWCIYNLAGSAGNLVGKVEAELAARCQRLGMSVGPCILKKSTSGNSNILAELDDLVLQYRALWKTAPNPELEPVNPRVIVVILPPIAPDQKHVVKFWGDCMRGIATQCVRADKLTGGNLDQYWANVAQKINARLGGINSLVTFTTLPNVPFMIIGADVAHAAPNTMRPSYVGLSWSADPIAHRYGGEVGVQDPRVESIQNLGEMVVAAVKKWSILLTRKDDDPKKRKEVLPEKIYFLRDGLSDAEFTNVGHAELYDMKTALTNLYMTREQPVKPPTFTYIFVVKRHHIKFFPPEFMESAISDKKGNVRAGFVTSDEQIRHPRFKEFYLQSHTAIQGTARSARHVIYEDENDNYNVDRLQNMCFGLCHVYSNASRSVSLPAPVYYADKICARAQYHYHPDNKDVSFSDSGSSSSEMFDLAAWKAGFKSAHRNVFNSFYL